MALGFLGLGDREKSGRTHGGDGASGVEGDGDVVGGNGVRKFGDGQDIVGICREERADEGTAEGLDGSADGGEGIGTIVHEGLPGRTGEADLVRIAAHKQFFLGEGRIRV